MSLVLCKGKEEIERKNSFISGSSSEDLPSSSSTPSLYRRLAQTEADTELVPPTITEEVIQASIIETQANAQELQEKAQVRLMNFLLGGKIDRDFVKVVEPDTPEVDASGTHRAAVQKSKKVSANEASLHKVLQAPECLDEAAITINFLTRRILCDMFEVSFFKDLIKTKAEMKLKEIAVSILENLRVTSIDLGNTFPVILKIEPMQWNTQGIWFNLFLYYRGSFK